MPLQSLTVVGDNLSFIGAQYQEIIKDELNVKEVKLDSELSRYADKTVYLYTPLLGKALGKDMGPVMGAYKQGKWELNADGTLNIAGQTLNKDLFEVRLNMKEGVAGQAFADNKAVVTLDTDVTDALRREGMARDFVRLVQTLRKDKDFNISDRIELCYRTTDAELALALEENKAYVAEQVLAVKLKDDCSEGTEADIEGMKIVFNARVTDAKVA